MKQKSILLVGGGLLQVPAVAVARELGLRVFVSDADPDAPAMHLADRAFTVDKHDAAGHVVLAEDLKETEGLDAVFTQGNSVEVTVAEAARAAGLPGLDPEVARRIANKGSSRQCLTEAGIPQPRFAVALSFLDTRHAAAHIGYPVVVKPPDNSGSRGLTKVYSPEELTFEVYQRARQASGDYTIVVEEMLEPLVQEIAEQSVETVWENGRGHFLNWVDRPFVESAYYAIEVGHLNPAMHAPAVQREVEQMVLAAGTALGMTTGIFKCDVMLTRDGPRILETTARLSGGFDAQYTTPLAHGANYIRGAMKLALGEGIDWDDFMPRLYRHACALAIFPETGRLRAIAGVESAKEVPGVEEVFLRVKPGDVLGDYTTCVDRPVFVIARGNSRGIAVRAAEKALKLIDFQMEVCA